MDKNDQHLVGGRRKADDPIYLQSDRRKDPKEVFKQLGNHIGSEKRGAGTSVLDAGCATGELLCYLQDVFPDFEFSGFDVSENLIETAAGRFPDMTFTVASITDPDPLAGKKFDVTCCVGVLSIFDDPTPALRNLINGLKPGGSLFVANSFNEDPIDVLVRYRPAEDVGSDWQTGWNILSMQSAERILRDLAPGISIQWHPFKLPFAIPKSDDPMRSWTIETADDPYQQVSGVCQLRKVYIMQATLAGS